MSKLTSIDYANIINWIAYNKFGVLLNKTQMQKILFISYGVYLATYDTKLFEDDTPKAWPFGPVFPRVNKHFNPGIPKSINEDLKQGIIKNENAVRTIISVVEKYHKYSAKTLSEWSHQPGGPWSQTVYGENAEKKEIQWNLPIEDDKIKIFFRKAK